MPDRIVRYILAGDSRGSVRAMEETAVASEKTGKVLDRTGKQAETSLARTEKGAKSLHGAIRSVAGTVGLAGMAFGIHDVVKAGLEWQTQQAQLQNALRQTGQAGKENIKVINEAIDASATHGGFTQPEQERSFAQFIRLTGSASKAIKLNTEATSIARGAHLDYAQAVRMVSQIQTGNTGRLQKYLGIIIPAKRHTQQLTAEYNAQVVAIKAATKGNRFLQLEQLAAAKTQYQTSLAQMQARDKEATATAANAAVLKKFGGATEAYSKSAAGSLSNATNSFHMLEVSIGRALLPTLSLLAGALAHNRTAIVAIAIVLGTLGVVIGTVRVATAAWAAAQKIAAAAQAIWTAVTEASTAAWWALNFAMEANPIGVVVIAIAALIAIVIVVTGHFGTFRRIVAAVWTWLKGAVVDTVGFVRRHWKLLASILGGPFVAVGIYVATHLKQVRHEIGAVADWIAKKFKWLTDKVLAPFRALSHAVGGIKHFASGTVGTVSHFLSHPFGLHAGGLVPAFAAGGPIGGSGAGDSQLIRATPGEFMIRKQVVDAVGGRNLQQLNNTGALGVSIEATSTPIILGPAFERAIAEMVTHYVAKVTARK